MWFDKEKQEELVSCNQCKHVIFKKDAQCIEVKTVCDYTIYDFYSETTYSYYCVQHKVPYDGIVKNYYRTPDNRFYKNIPAHREYVTEKGEKIEVCEKDVIKN